MPLEELLNEVKPIQPAVVGELARIGAELRALREMLEPIVQAIMDEIERERA